MTSAATLAAGVLTASRYRGDAARPPDLRGARPDVSPAVTEVAPIPAGDRVGRAAHAAAETVYHREGQPIDGRGPGTHRFGGRFYRAPEVPDLPNFRPVGE